MTIDKSNYSNVIAVIQFNGENTKYIFNPSKESEIADFLYEKIGEKVNDVNNVPVFMEASSWCYLASVDDEYETEDFIIEILERD